MGATLERTVDALEREAIDYELVVVDDHSTDRTAEIVAAIGAENPRVRCVRSTYEPGFGLAIRAGLDAYTGDAVAVMKSAPEAVTPAAATTARTASEAMIRLTPCAPWRGPPRPATATAPRA